MPDAGVRPLVELSVDRKLHRGLDGADGARPVLADLSLAVWPGEILCLAGPSGCGKTTALRILVGLDRAFEGRVAPDPAGLDIRMMFQEPRLLPWRTVEENVRLVLPPRRRRADLGALFAEVGLEAWRARYPAELSLGLARRAALARALVDPPALLVLDEPFVSLDDRAADDLRRVVLDRARRDRMAVVLVTHNLREAVAMADRILVLAPAPTRVIGEVRLDRPRAERPADWIEAQHRNLAARFATADSVVTP